LDRDPCHEKFKLKVVLEFPIKRPLENCHIGSTLDQESEEISKREYFLPIWIQNFRENHAMNKDYDKNDSFLLENKERNGE